MIVRVMFNCCGCNNQTANNQTDKPSEGYYNSDNEYVSERYQYNLETGLMTRID